MLTFYKPNKSVKGSLANFSFNSKGEKKGIFIELVKQTAWDEASGSASFKNGEKVNVKLSLIEVGALIKAIERNEAAAEKGFYHSTQAGSALINFSPYSRDGAQIGFSLSVSKQEGRNEKKNFYIGFDFSECVLLREFLKFSLEHVFSGMYSDALKARKENSKGDE